MDEKKSKIPMISGLVILTVPNIIFLLGWVKLIIAIPITLFIIFGMLSAVRSSDPMWVPKLDGNAIFKILFICGIIAFWVYISGVGKLGVFQNGDHAGRNGIFNALVQNKWPVIYDGKMLVYYIGYWLPAAVVGKLAGLRAGYCFQSVWAFLIIALVYYFICTKYRKILIWPLFVLIFFSGLDIVGIRLLLKDVIDYAHIEWWMSSAHVQYSSTTTQLFWVFNQALPAWLATMLIMTQTNCKNFIFILANLLLSASFPFVGLFIVVCGIILTRKYVCGSAGGYRSRASDILPQC